MARLVAVALGVWAVAIWPAAPGAAAQIDANATFAAVARYRHGDDRKPLHDLEQLVRDAERLAQADPQGVRRGLADRMASFLGAKDATPAGKAAVCRQLAALGTERHASALAALLADREVAPAALGALSQIPGPTVDQILRDALATLQGDLRIGAVAALGQRRDRQAVGPLGAMLTAGDEALACAAAGALGNIGDEAAAAELRKALSGAKGRLRTEAAHACLRCAERMLAETKRDAAAAIFAALAGKTETPEVRMAALR
ncbi:MAG: HEAT repeat domain-containing protein, partial [Thermoguttaceae bacterium]|nr:HEAT repeat domain-containing protein [Thermoguttaceae bacterium]